MDTRVIRAVRFFYLLSGYTIVTFLWRFLVPAHEEAEGDTLIYLEILLEFATVGALIILFSHLRSRYGDNPTSTLTTIFCIALAASIGILVMRYSTTEGWYTGHRIYQPGYRSLRMPPENQQHQHLSLMLPARKPAASL
jgi:hypothetical protein